MEENDDEIQKKGLKIKNIFPPWATVSRVPVVTELKPEDSYDVIFVLPAAFACYKTDGNLKKLKGNIAYLNLMIDANIEGYRAIRNAGHEILPKSVILIEIHAYNN